MLISILDDNIMDIQIITAALKKYSIRSFNEEITTKCFHSIPDFLESKADLYFIDIDLGEDSGFDVAKAVYMKHPESLLIACTTHNELIYESYDYNFFFFIRKQFIETDMERLFQKYAHYSEYANQAYTLHVNNEIVTIPYIEILYFEISHNSLFIHTLNSEYEERKSMRKLLSILPASRFVQIDKNFCINLHYVQRIVKDTVILKYTDDHLKISSSRLHNVKQSFTHYLNDKSRAFAQIGKH